MTDRIVFYNSEVSFVEVKTVDGRLSTAQIREHERLAATGAIIHVVYGEAGVDSFVRQLTSLTPSREDRAVQLLREMFMCCRESVKPNQWNPYTWADLHPELMTRLKEFM